MKILCITRVAHIPGITDRLNALGHVDYLPDIAGEDLKSEILARGVDTIFTNPNMQGFVMGAMHLSGTQVRIVCTASTGLNHIDVAYCRAAGIRIISITKEIDTIKKITSTAELSFAFLLSAIRHLPDAQRSVQDGHWTWAPYLGRQVKDLSVGIVGLGRLGTMMADYCAAFGAKVRYIDPNVKSRRYERLHSIEKIFETSDAVSLHVHVKDDTREMINSRVLSFGTEVVLINTSRGEIVNERDVVSALDSGSLSHYSTDVLVDEFGDITKSPLLGLPTQKATVTPHIGGSTVGAQSIAYHRAIDLLEEAE